MDEKLIVNVTPKKRHREARYWSFFFVDDTGRIFYFDHAKGLAYFLIILVSVSVIAAGIAIKIATDRDRENRQLAGELSAMQSEMIQLKTENEEISVKLIEKNVPKVDEISPETAEDENGSDKIHEISAETHQEMETTIPEKNTHEPVKPVFSPTADSNPVKFDVTNFFVSHNPEKKKLNVQFKLSKVSGKKGRTTGQIVVVLDGNNGEKKIRIVLPADAKLAGDFTSVDKGKSFSIASYNYIRTSTDYGMNIKFLKNATVFVFDAEKKLISKDKFPITIR